MKLKFTLLFLVAIVAVSCKKTTNVDVKISSSGKLSYRLLDDAGKGLAGVKVSLFDNANNVNNYPYNTILLDSRKTDQNGIADFGDLNPSNYYIVPDSPVVNNIKYNISEYVQVQAGVTKQKDTKVSDFSGTANIVIRSYYNNSLPMKNVGVLLIPGTKYISSNSVSAYTQLSEFKGVTNDTGMVSFKTPSAKSYNIVVYNVTTNVIYTNYSSYSITKDAVLSFPILIYSL